MPEPLARDEDRAADVEAEGVVLERRPVPVAHQEADQPGVGVVDLLAPAREADAGGVDDGEVVGHRGVEADEAVVEDGDGAVGYHFARDCHAISRLARSSDGQLSTSARRAGRIRRGGRTSIPPGLANEDFLSFYAQRLPSVELNSTGYRLPSEEQFARWAAQTPDGFRFAVKMPPQALRALGTFEERVRRLGDRLGPVRVVVESPRDDGLLALLLGSTGLRLALDLRDESWDGVDVAPAVRVGRLGRRRALPLPPLPRPAVLRRDAASSSRHAFARCSPRATEVFAYFRHEDAPTAPAYAARLLELVRAEER